MFHKRLAVFTLLIMQALYSCAANGYHYYFVYFKDKQHTPYSIAAPQKYLSDKAIARREKFNISIDSSDLPLTPLYVQTIAGIKGIELWNRSKWLNALEIRTTDTLAVSGLNMLTFVRKIQYLGYVNEDPNKPEAIDSTFLRSSKTNMKSPLTEESYGRAFEQNNLINLLPLHNKGYRGNGISIAILDAGFNNAYRIPGVNINESNTPCRDFVTHDNSIWEDDRHGANVFGFMRAFQPGTYIGTAPFANYMLLRTEQTSSETPSEEVNWVAAAEYADSAGVDMISSSLGYTVFDNPALGHTFKEYNGKTTIVAIGANAAVAKGIAVVVSAGNEGNNSWEKIGTPGDAPSVITIGATDDKGYYADFSSRGRTADGRIKPDLTAMGKKAYVTSPGGTYQGNGTSYATPIFAGALACLIESCPGKTPAQLKTALLQSGTHSFNPDSLYGYGIPDVTLASMLLGNYQGTDTTKDIFWQHDKGPAFREQLIHFRSAGTQKVTLVIKGLKKKKWKNIAVFSYDLKPGEWLHSNEVQNAIANTLKLKKRKRLKMVSYEFITASATWMRSFTLQVSK